MTLDGGHRTMYFSRLLKHGSHDALTAVMMFCKSGIKT